jgi:regulator of PEP synthase PpsR (kinase-PPPase family)
VADRQVDREFENLTPSPANRETDEGDSEPLKIHIVSGGVGASAELLTHTVLAQYPGPRPELIIHPHIHDVEDVRAIVNRAASEDALILHTLVNEDIRGALIEEARRQQVDAIDLAGPIMDELSHRLHAEPIGQPGLYRKLYGQYFKRVDAIEFTIAHDDGKRTEELNEADIVLMGVSRLGKTPLSVYLAMQGWKVANVPFVPGIRPPDELWNIDARNIVGLTIEPPQLAVHRKWRERRLGIGVGDYVDQKQVAGELREANRFFTKYGIPIIDVTDKPIETSGAEIVAEVTRRHRNLTASTLQTNRREGR